MPNFINFSPTPDQTDVAKTAVISFTILADDYGTNINTLNVDVDSINVIEDGSFINGYSGRIFASTGKHVVGIYPKAPSFLRSSAEIVVNMEVENNVGDLDSYSYNFHTAGGYIPPDPPEPDPPSRACVHGSSEFPPTDLGLVAARDQGTGTEISLNWKVASPSDVDNITYYNIYYSTDHDNVFDGYPELFAINNSVTIGGFEPGMSHYFGLRSVEINPQSFTYSGMIHAGEDLFYHPMVGLDGALSADAMFIPVNSTDGFSDYGILLINDELIRYSSLSTSPVGFVVRANGRGYLNSIAEEHSDGSTIFLYLGREDTNTLVAMCTPTFQKPRYARTVVLGDGYGPDGYRDGYDGYGDGYFMYRQNPIDSITTDGSNNDASGDFHRLDYCGTWRTMSPYSFMRGQCRNTYFGGAQKRDGHLVKVTDVRTHMLQREELLLETTGEPFVLLRRMWTGTRCMCFMNRREHPDARCGVCFVPGTLIRTKNGYVPIENVKVGDFVLSSDGSYRAVTKTFENQYDGYLCSITSTISSGPILATPEHPFLTLVSDHNIKRNCGPKCNYFIKNGDGILNGEQPRQLRGGNWIARATVNSRNRIHLGTFCSKETASNIITNFKEQNSKPAHRLEWSEIKNIKENDWLVSKWNAEEHDICFINIPKQFRKNTTLGSKRNGSNWFKVDEEFLWIIGLYIAEGSCSSRCINFALHKDETQYQNRIIDFFKKYGFTSKIIKTSENGVAVYVYSTSLAKWLPNWIGKKCYNKSIPEELMSLPKNKLWALFNGIYDGDGAKARHEIGQTSKILALQLIELLHKFGKHSLARVQRSNTLTPNGNKRRICYVVSWEEETTDHINRKGRWIFNNEVLTKVRNTDRVLYSGKVYNLEVDGNHTYVVENIVVHNCHGTGFVQGFSQFLNTRRSDRRILVRLDPTNEDLSIVDRGGLEPVYEPSAWTMAYPALKDRDVLIRFNPDNTEEFRYVVLDVNRVRALFAQSGAQKFRMKRIVKTDIIYQFPILRDSAPRADFLQTSTDSGDGIPAHSHLIPIKYGTVDVNKITVATLESELHNHIIFNGRIYSVLDHTHTILV